MSKNSKPTNAFYVSPWMAAIPLLVMVVPAVVVVFKGVFSAKVMIMGGVVGLMLGSIFARNKKEYWEVVVKALGDPTGLLAFALFLIVGVYAELLTVSNLGEGVIWLSNLLQTGPIIFTVFIYVICSVLGTAMGTSVGVIFILTPILYPVALQMGIPSGLAAGAILSGAATGDHFSPVSDTTLISSMTQRYKFRDAAAEVGEVVSARMKYVIPAFLISCVCYGIAGAWIDTAMIPKVANSTADISPNGLIMIFPMIVVIWSAVKGGSVFQSITYGVFSGLIIALLAQLITFEQIFSIKDRELAGILVDGAMANIDTVMLIVLMMGAYGVMRHYGLIDAMVSKLSTSFTNSPRNTELTILGLGTVLSFVLVGLVTRIAVIAGPVINELGQKHNIHPCRRANILDAVANGLSYVIPWHVWPLLMILTISPLQKDYDYIVVPDAVNLVLLSFHPMVSWGLMLLAILTGFGRKFEIQEKWLDGKRSNEI